MTFHDTSALEKLGGRIKDSAVKSTIRELDLLRQAHEQGENPMPYERELAGSYGQATNVSVKVGNIDRAMHDPEYARSFAEHMYADVPQLFSVFGENDPSECKGASDALWGAAAILDPKLDLTIRIEDGAPRNPVPVHYGAPNVALQLRQSAMLTRMKDWEGAAANAFQSNFVKQMPKAIGLQARTITSLAITMEANLEIRRRANDDIWEIGQKTMTALDQVDDCDPAEVGCVLSVVGAVVGIIGTLVAAPESGGLSLAGTAAIISGLFGAAGASVGLSGATVPSVMQHMRSAITTVKKSIHNEEKELRRAVEKLCEHARQDRQQLRVPHPVALTSLKGEDVSDLKDPNGTHSFYVEP